MTEAQMAECLAIYTAIAGKRHPTAHHVWDTGLRDAQRLYEAGLAFRQREVEQAITDELGRVSEVEYNSRKVCTRFAEQVLKRLNSPAQLGYLQDNRGNVIVGDEVENENARFFVGAINESQRLCSLDKTKPWTLKNESSSMAACIRQGNYAASADTLSVIPIRTEGSIPAGGADTVQSAWQDYAIRAGLCDAHGNALDVIRANTSWFTWEAAYKDFQAQATQPVAWRYKIINGQWTYSGSEPSRSFAGDAWGKWEVTPLYTRPAPLADRAGWKMVPVDPDKAMVDAAEPLNWADEDVRANLYNLWHAMIAAAPTPPAAQGETAALEARLAEFRAAYAKSDARLQMLRSFIAQALIEGWEHVSVNAIAALADVENPAKRANGEQP